MPVTLLQNVEFGRQRANVTGSMGVGYAVYDAAGGLVSPRTTSGVFQVVSGSGLYAANVAYPDGFNGQIVWDCPPMATSSGLLLSQSFAIEQYNVQANDPRVANTWQMVSDMTGSVQGLFDVAFGRWKIDAVANTMTFYRTDNSTVVAVFSLLDNNGVPAFDGVFERRLASSVRP